MSLLRCLCQILLHWMFIEHLLRARDCMDCHGEAREREMLGSGPRVEGPLCLGVACPATRESLRAAGRGARSPVSASRKAGLSFLRLKTQQT